MKKKKRISKPKKVILAFSLSLFVIFSVFTISLIGKIDFAKDIRLFEANRAGNVTKFYYDRDLSDNVYTPVEFAELKPFGDSKVWYSYEEIGQPIKDAFISVEDRIFFEHKGVDVKRTLYAAVNLLTKKRERFGASTITQQVIKNISGDNEGTLSRKFAEILRAFHIEKRYSKEELFEVYLNIVPMGEGICGVGLASEHYFGKTPDELTAEEAATLVGITNAPSRYSPSVNYDLCLKKRNSVLYAMLDNGCIDEAEYKRAVSSYLTVKENRKEGGIYSWFVETVCDDIIEEFCKVYDVKSDAAWRMLTNGGYSVYTTVDPKIQKILEDRFYDTDLFPEAVKVGLNYSMVVTDSNTGELRGIVGGVGKKTANRVLNFATAPQTPGSLLKPLALYAPLINSGKITWSTVFDDVPVEFLKDGSGNFVPYPKNYPNVYDGLTTVSDALRLSKNTVAVRLYKMSDKNKIFRLLKYDFGFDTMIESEKTKDGGKITDIATAPLALGQLSYGVSLRRLTEAYTVFSREGEFQGGRSYLFVLDGKGNTVIDNSSAENRRIFSRECARIMNQLLSGVVESGTAKAIRLKEIFDTAGKTGTSGNDKDRLFVGYTPYYTAGIWCGYSKNEMSVGNQSISHLEIWDSVMREIHSLTVDANDERSFSTDGLKYLPYCKDSGGIYTKKCSLDPRGERKAYGYFASGIRTHLLCERHVECMYDSVCGAVAVRGCPHEYLEKISLLDISDRSFPCEVIITDAEYVWRKVSDSTPLADSYDVPYFIYELESGEYVGRSKGKKQYNSSCYLHSD